jgi:YhcH/YjgK/YiaL family protein
MDMIIDTLNHSQHYYGLHPRLRQSFQFLINTDLNNLESGKYEIDGTHIFALVQEYTTKPKEKGLWEAHRNYLDIQYIVKGLESFGYAPVDSLKETKSYDTEHDYALFAGEGSFLGLAAGSFALVFPQDAHMPSITRTVPEEVKKIVVKIHI